MNNILSERKNVFIIALFFAMCFSHLESRSQTTAGQGVASLNVTGIPAVIEAPFTDQFEQNFRNGRYQLIFTFNSSSFQPVDFRFRFRVTRGGKEVLEVTSDPKQFQPGAYVFTSVFDELPFPITFKEAMEKVDGNLRRQLIQEGTVPEGNYLLTVEAISENGSGTIASSQSVTPFTVRYPQPPMLINPSDESNLTLEMPVFNWTPVVGIQGYPIQYNFLLVEVLSNQTPLQAINSNRAHAQRSVIDQNTLVYTPEFLPMEEGKQYAWQVTAGSPNRTLPLKQDGQSEIHTFVYKEGASEETIADVRSLQSIPLIPDFANLVDLGGLEVREEANSFVLNGRASLELDFIGSNTQTVQVLVNELRLQNQSLASPVLMGGSVRGEAGQIASIPGSSNNYAELNEILWEFGKGVDATVDLSINGEDTFQADGRITLTADGARGTVRITGSPLMTFNEDLAEAEINEIEASFPEGTVSGEGSIRIFGSDTGCETSRFALQDDTFSTIFNCESPFDIPVVENSDHLQLNVRKVRGTVAADLQTNSLDYRFDLNSTVGLLTDEGETCGTDAIITAEKGAGIQINSGQERCQAIQPRIDLGFVQLELTETQLESLSFNPVQDDWDFELNLGAKIQIPAFESWSSAEIEDILVDEEGIHIDEIAFDDRALTPLPDYTVNDFHVQLQSLLLRKLTFPFFEWDRTGPGPWDLAFSGEVSVPNSGNFPKCIRGLNLDLTGGKVDGNRVLGEVEMSNFQGCAFDFGAGYSMNITDLSGQFGVEYAQDGDVEPVGRLDFGGSLTSGRPFMCETDGTVPLGNNKLSFTTGLNGTLEDVVPPCEVAIGPFTARVTNSDISFSHTPASGQQALMDASAELELPDGQMIQGSFELDLITGRFNSVNFNVNNPFEWKIPEDDPVLTFQINSAQLNENGFLVDGRQQFLLDSGKQIGTTFDNLLINLETRQIDRGRVIFDESFGMTAGIDMNDQSLNFKAVETGTELTEDPGLYMELAGQVVIDSTGLHADGHAGAEVSFNGQRYDSLATVEFKDDFSFQLFPFRVGSGQADFLLDGSRFAYADPSGFHPEAGFFADLLVPELLPLPSEDIAYLRLRDGDQLLVEATKNGDGNYVLSTKPNAPLTLTAPVLDANNPPVLSNITLDNVVISSDPTDPEVLEGAIIADVPVNDPSLQLTDRNVPLTLRRLYFGSRPVNGNPITALYMLGDLHLFESDLPHAEEAEFYIQSDGVIRANLNMSGMDARIPLLPDNQASLRVDAVSGTFDLLKDSSTPTYDLQVDGGLEIDTESGFSTGADMGIRVTPGNFTVNNFNADTFDAEPEIDFGIFGLKLKALESLPVFDYSRQNGFDFAVALDVDLRIQPAGGEQFIFPLQGLEIRDTGIHLPIQNINQSSIPGLDLPVFSMGGFEFKPLSLETNSTFAFDWADGAEFNPDVSLSFEVQLPEFEGTGLNPPDGLTFNNVSLDGGYLTGSVAPFQPLGGAEIPLMPGMPDTPTLMISEIFGSLSRNQNEQVVDIQVSGDLGNLPAFNVDNPGVCVNNPSFTLSLVESRYFEGSVTGFQPCGYLTLGPAKLSVSTADLNFSVSDDTQLAELDGGVDLTLPAPNDGTPITASGAMTIDLITGEISNGSVNINQPFALDLPFGSNDPILNFTVNQAVLDKNGLEIQGGGGLLADGAQANVQFNNLLLGFDPFAVKGGSATIDSDFDAEIGLSPFSFSLIDTTSQLPADNAIRLGLNADMELNSSGLVFGGTSTATILFNGTEYASLRAELLNGFTLNVGGFSVNSGRAEFYDDSEGLATDPLAILDESGFNLGSQILSLLPSRIPLPTEDVAYVDIKDSNDSLLVDLSQNSGGGYTINTDGQPLKVVVPALPDQSGNSTEVDVEFSLTTDDAYNVTGGTLTLQSETSLASSLDLPVSLTQLEVTDDGNGMELKAGLKVDLPSVLQDHDALVNATITSNGIESGSFTLGDHRTAYQTGLTPLYTYTESGNISGSSETDTFEASLLGIEATFGNSNSIAMSGTLSSSLIMDVSEGDEPVFFLASWSDTGWTFEVDPGNKVQEMMMGDATISPNEHEGIQLQTDNDSFYLILNGTISLEDVLGEPLDVSVQNLEVGVDNWNTNPSMHFALGSAAGTLADQPFSLFDGALTGLIEEPSITLNGRSVALSSSAGTLTFLEKDIDYTNLILDTDGTFGFGEIQAGEVTLIEDYLDIKSMTLSGDSGLRLDAELEITLPEPVGQTSTSTISIYRDNQNQVQVEASDPAFDLDQNIGLGDFGHFKLTDVAADIDPYDWQQSGVYANGELYKTGETEPILYFGESATFPDNAGLGFSPAQSPVVQYNVTGNVPFTFDFSVFTVTVAADQIAATQDGFEITLNGSADINLEQMEANLGYSGFTITQNGVEDIGNLDGTGSIDMSGIGTLTIGQFIYESNPNGKQIELADTSPKGPDELDGSEEGTGEAPVTVVELLCFGPCPADTGSQSTNSALHLSIGADSNSDSGGFSGGVHSIFFYETLGGKRELYIEDFNASIDDFFTMTASLNYMQDEDEFLLRAAASGEFDIGDVTAGASVAGKFAHIDGETSYGLFVAAKAEPGIPIVPGIIDLNGAAGGFFWKPEQEDLNTVATALSGFGYDLVNEDAMPEANSVSFAAMLYADLGILGTANQYMIEGQTFLQITDQSFYMDARGTVLQMDGEGIASASVKGDMYIAMQRDPFFILGDVGILLEVPGTVKGEGNIEYFLRKANDDLVWGIIGNAQFNVFGDILSGDGEFLAAQKGFLMEIGVEFNVGVPLISVKSDVTGSIWLIDDPDFSLPFGAYVVFNAEACLGVCITAEAKGAFATTSSGFAIYAAVKGCVDLWVDEACVSASATVKESGIDASFGGGGHSDLIAQAQDQQNRFRQHIEDMKNQIADAKAALEEPPEFSGFGVSGADVRKAGANFYAQSKYIRESALSSIRNDVEISPSGDAYFIPDMLEILPTYVMLEERSYKSFVNTILSPEDTKFVLVNYFANIESMSDQVTGLLDEGLRVSIENREMAESTFDSMMTSMSQSPVSNVYTPTPSANVTESPSFEVDETVASDQADNAVALKDEIEKLDQQFRESIAEVEASLEEMHGILNTKVEGSISQDPPYESDLNIVPGVKVLTGNYSHIISLMEEYFALEANKRWLEWKWATDRRSTLHQVSSQIHNGIQELNNDFNSALANRTANPVAYQNEVYRAAQRGHTITRFRDSTFTGTIYGPGHASVPETVQTTYDELIEPNCPGNSLGCIQDSVAVVNNRFWYDMHDLGLRDYAYQSSRRVLNEVVPAHNQLKGSLLSPLKEITALVDQFYTNKASLTSILYNMIDNYNGWRQSVEVELDETDTSDSNGPAEQDTVAVVNYEQRLQELSDELVPPQITDITVNPDRPSYASGDAYFNITDISWNATHPVKVVENSIDIKEFEEDTDISVGYEDYLSIGDKTSLTIYPYKRTHPRTDNPSLSEIALANTRKINVGVRARGRAGNTAIRRATFDVDVGPEGQSVSPGSSVLSDNVSPPEKPILWLSSFYEKATTTQLERVMTQTQFGLINISVPVEVDEYWTNDPSTIQLHIQAHDPESGIATYEYAVGSTQGGTDVIEWTELQGTREFLSYVPTSEMIGQTRMINMKPDQKYYVSIRVTNGAGLTSQVLESETPVIYDDELPSKPGIAYIAQPLQQSFYSFGYTTPVDPVLESVPSLDTDPEILLDWADAEIPEIERSWAESSDNESGVSHYEYVVTTSEEVPYDEFDEPGVRTTEELSMVYSGGYASSLLEDYETEIYVHVRAKDFAGNASEVRTLGPAIAKDPTSPVGGKIQAKIDPYDVKLYLVELPYDPETDLEGIQYALGTSPGATDLRDWPDQDNVDFDWSSEQNGNLYWQGLSYNDQERYVSIPKSQLPAGETFYISYRVVNGQGKKSGTRSTGPINLDETQPLTPSVSLSYSESSSRLQLDIDNLEDPESGIKSVEYSVRYPASTLLLKDWTAMHDHSGIKHGSFDLSKYINFADGQISNPSLITVKVRITNGAGLQRTIQKTVPADLLSDQTQTQYDFNSSQYNTTYDLTF